MPAMIFDGAVRCVSIRVSQGTETQVLCVLSHAF